MAGSHSPSLWWHANAFLYFGRIHVNKGVVYILDAWLRLAGELGERCPDLWLAGGTPEEIETIRPLACDPSDLAHYEAIGRIRWWGYLDAFGVAALLLKSHCLIMHSRYEPGGRVVVEAMAEGIPVIATPHGFADELVADWVNGFRVDFGNIELLVHRMRHFALHPYLGASLGTAARETARAALGSWSFVRRHLDTYQALARRQTAPTSGDDRQRVRNPVPGGLTDRFPFEPERLDRTAVACWLESLGYRGKIRQLRPQGQLQRWIVYNNGEMRLVHHPYSVYCERVLWNKRGKVPWFWKRGSGGPWTYSPPKLLLLWPR